MGNTGIGGSYEDTYWRKEQEENGDADEIKK